MRVALSHWYGPENLGDLAILCAQYSLLAALDDDLHVELVATDTAAIGSAAATGLAFDGIHVLPWQSPSSAGWSGWALGGARALLCLLDPQRLTLGADLRRFRDLLLRVEMLMPKGGGYLYARGGLRGPLFTARICWPLLLARRLKVRRVVWGHSIGPCESRPGAMILRHALKGAEIVVRDRASLAILKKWKIPARMAPDLAFRLVADDLDGSLARPGAGLRRIGLTARTLARGERAQATYEDTLRRGLNTLVEQVRYEGANVEVVGIVQSSGPSSRENDRHVLARVLAGLDCRTVLEAPGEGRKVPTMPELLAVYATLDLLVATRMHSAILASCAGRPFVVTEYIGGKARGMVEALGLPDWVYLADLNDLSSTLSRAWRERTELERLIRRGARQASRELEKVTSIWRSGSQ